MKKYLGMLGLLIVTIIWGGGFVASDIALSTFTPFQIMTIRFFIGAIVMTIISRKNLKTITRQEVFSGFVLGLFLFGGFAFQIVGLQYTTPSKNAFLTATNVIFVPFIAMIIFKKKIPINALIGTVIAIVGAGILSLTSNFTIGIGDGLTLLCAICFAFQIFFTGLFVDKIRPTILNFMQMSSAFILSLLGFLLSGNLKIHVSKESVFAVLYLGLVSTTITYLLQTISQKYVDETRSAIILSMEAVFGTIFSVIILKENVTAKMIIGSVLILLAVIISEIRIKK